MDDDTRRKLYQAFYLCLALQIYFMFITQVRR